MVGASAPSHTLHIQLSPTFNSHPLSFDSLTNITAAGQQVSITRLDFLLSDFSLSSQDGSWMHLTNSFAFISGRAERTSFELGNLPAGRYQKLRFHVGLLPEINHKDSAVYPAGHPLNPQVNGLHWGWSGGYVFLALEGNWLRGDSQQSGYSYHLATDAQLTTIELPLDLDLFSDCQLILALNVDQIFAGPNQFVLSEETTSTHSRSNDALAVHLRQNLERAFAIQSVRTSRQRLGVRQSPAALPFSQQPLPHETDNGQNHPNSPTAIIAATAVPYRFTISAFFPRPVLPQDNPLTEEGVELGRLLFFDPQLSVNNSQSCASCHQAPNAFSEHKTVSTGAQGKAGTRNAMPLLNLAWKSSFFWDGRAATLRQQVLQPIQNPIEMRETLTDLISKLRSSRPQEALEEKAPSSKLQAPSPLEPALDSAALELGIWDFSGAWSLELGASYPSLFRRAFGSPHITADRIARALEQFLLSQTSYDSKFDRVLRGEAQFTAAEQRGFELFHTEYEPRREQYGADCFHCHGGPLFQSQTFANNGLDADFKDLGRFLVTGKEGDRGKFAVPSLRNVEVTGPYMHDGRFRTLEEVIEHYSTGVKRSPTLDPNLAKHPDRGIQLSSRDKAALVAFLKTLTDARFLTNTSTIARSF